MILDPASCRPNREEALWLLNCLRSMAVSNSWWLEHRPGDESGEGLALP